MEEERYRVGELILTMDPRDHSKLTIIQYEIQQIVMTFKEHVIPETLDIYVRRVQKASCVLNSPRITSVGFFLEDLSLQQSNWALSLFSGDVVMIVIELD